MIPHRVRGAHVVRAKTSQEKIVVCSVFDRVYQGRESEMVFFYPKALDEGALLKGLAITLEKLPVFAGRLRSNHGSLEIVCNNAGVNFTTIDANVSLPELLAALPGRGAELVLEKIPASKARAGRCPLFGARLCRFVDGTAALSCCFDHAIGDAESLALFMRTWSAAVEGQTLPQTLVVEDRHAYLAEHLPPGGSGQPLVRFLTWPELARFAGPLLWDLFHRENVQIYFSPSEIQRMKAAYTAEVDLWLSPSDALSAHLMHVITACESTQKKRWLTIVVDFRAHANLDPGVIGNMVTNVYLELKKDQSPAILARRIREGILSVATEHLEYRATASFAEGLGHPEMIDRCVPLMALRPGTLISNLSHFKDKDFVFGSQTPVFFAAAAGVAGERGSNIFSYVDIPGNQGFLVSGGLPPQVRRRFTSPSMLKELHRFRAHDDGLPDILRGRADIL